LETTVLQHNIKILVTWNEDQDHLRCCLAYKSLQKLRKANFSNISLVDIDEHTLGDTGAKVSGMGRGDDDEVFVFNPSVEYICQISAFLKNNE